MKFLTLSAAAALSALLVTALPSQALPPVGLNAPAPLLHQQVHYPVLRPWTEQTEDHYCRRKAERVCHRVYPEDPHESHTHYLQRNYCASNLYEKCSRARELGASSFYSRH